MVRRPAPLLTAALAALGALAYFLGAALLPDLGTGDAAALAAGAAGLAFVVALAALVAPGAAAPTPVWLLVLGGGLVVATLNAAGAGAAATPAEAVLFAGVGVLFAAALRTPSLALALPLFVAVVDLAALGGGAGTGGSSAEILARGATGSRDPLLLTLPAWTAGLTAAQVGVTEAVFLGAFGGYAHLFGLRPRATAAAMFAGLWLVIAIAVLLDRTVPALPLLAAGYYLPNLDRLRGLARQMA